MLRHNDATYMLRSPQGDVKGRIIAVCRTLNCTVPLRCSPSQAAGRLIFTSPAAPVVAGAGWSSQRGLEQRTA